MSLARGLERRLERLVDGIAARLFRGRIHPVELAGRLVREADLALRAGPFGPVAPNLFTVTLGGDPADAETVSAVEAELAAVVEETALERGWRLEGRVRVRLATSPGPASSAAVQAGFVAGGLHAWARLLAPGNRPPLPVAANRSVIGRSSESDVHFPDPEVSRRHALLWREAGAIWVTDLNSANGTFVNGERIAEPTEIVDGDLLTFGGPSFVFRSV